MSKTQGADLNPTKRPANGCRVNLYFKLDVVALEAVVRLHELAVISVLGMVYSARLKSEIWGHAHTTSSYRQWQIFALTWIDNLKPAPGKPPAHRSVRALARVLCAAILVGAVGVPPVPIWLALKAICR